MEEAILGALQSGDIQNSKIFAQEHGFDHNELVGVIKSLVADDYVVEQPFEEISQRLTDEGLQYLHSGSPEAQVFHFVKANAPVEMGLLQSQLQAISKIGFATAMKLKWINLDKATKQISPAVEDIQDAVQLSLQALQEGQSVPNYAELKKRKLAEEVKTTLFAIQRGPEYKPVRQKASADLTIDMLRTGSWKDARFKKFNVNAKGKPLSRGSLHPLLKLRAEFRRILLEMGFEEMPTNNFIESSFWNFDALFQPQQHPARDAHDTFFIADPELCTNFPQDYQERVKQTHEAGGYESIGWRYDWSLHEAQKNILRTHTTAVSSRMLYKLAQDGFQPKKYFSIDRVFRNEAVDSTHLAEFHQIEGVVADRNIGLADLIGTITEFFRRIGITELKYKPAYNPYTEPSMEIFGYHPILKKWTEIGNSGIFRPEMLRPMGLPEDVTVIAWGLSLERPAMIQYSIDNIRDLFGHKIELEKIQSMTITQYQQGITFILISFVVFQSNICLNRTFDIQYNNLIVISSTAHNNKCLLLISYQLPAGQQMVVIE